MQTVTGIRIASLLIITSIFLTTGCSGKSKKSGYKDRNESAQLGDAIVKITKITYREWDPKAPKGRITRKKPRNQVRIDMVIVKSFQGKPFKYYGWIDHKSKADSKNYAILSDSLGTKFSLIRGSGPGSLHGLEYDGVVEKITRSRSDHLVFNVPVETEGELYLNLSGWAFKIPGDIRFRIPLENWSLKDGK